MSSGVVRCALLATVALVLAGCGSGGADRPTASTLTARRTTSSSSTSTQGTTTATGSTTSTTAALPGTNRPSITLGDENTTEQFVLGDLYELALSAQGYSVSLIRNIGPPSVSYAALEQGNLNVYPEYLNVWNSEVVRSAQEADSIADAYETGATWAADHQLALLTPTPGADTQGIAVTAAYARKHRLRSLVDLARTSATLTIGAPLEYVHSAGGLPALERSYDFLPATTDTIVIGDQYTDLESGKIQAAYVNTTDGQLTSSKFRVLTDPHHVSGFGNIVPVVTAATLANEGPAFTATLNRVDSLLTTRVLRRLNADVELLSEDPGTVAKVFLVAHGVVPSSSP